MRKILDCIDSSMNALVKKATDIERLNDIVQRYFPEAAQIPCKVGSFNHGCLVLLVSDPGWATQLRFSLPLLRDRLRQEAGLHQLSSIKIKLQIDGITVPQPKKNNKPSKLSSQAREHIVKSSASTYGPLKAALERLGRSE